MQKSDGKKPGASVCALNAYGGRCPSLRGHIPAAGTWEPCLTELCEFFQGIQLRVRRAHSASSAAVSMKCWWISPRVEGAPARPAPLAVVWGCQLSGPAALSSAPQPLPPPKSRPTWPQCSRRVMQGLRGQACSCKAVGQERSRYVWVQSSNVQ